MPRPPKYASPEVPKAASTVEDDFSDATLVIIGHGSTVNSGSAVPVYEHAVRLRRHGIFAEVREAFWKQSPFISDVVLELSSRRVFFVPLMISEGYFSEQAIPKKLGFRSDDESRFVRVRKQGEQIWHYSAPVGTHPSMAEALLARACAVVEQHPFPRPPKPEQTALFVAGHGTTKDENSREAIEQQVAVIRSRRLYAEVHGVFLEEEPRIPECFALARARNLAIVPFFISEGLHTSEDIPVLLGESKSSVRRRLAEGRSAWRNPTERRGKLVWYARSIGNHPKVGEVIVERVRQIAALAP